MEILKRFWLGLGPTVTALVVGLTGLLSIVIAAVLLPNSTFLFFSASWGAFSLLAFIVDWSIKGRLQSESSQEVTAPNPANLGQNLAALVSSLIIFVLFLPTSGNLALSLQVGCTLLGIYFLAHTRKNVLRFSLERRWLLLGAYPFFEALIRLISIMGIVSVAPSFAALAIPLGPVLVGVFLSFTRRKDRSNRLPREERLIPTKVNLMELPQSLFFALIGVGFTLLGARILDKPGLDESLLDAYLVSRPAAILILVSLQSPFLLLIRRIHPSLDKLTTYILYAFAVGVLVGVFSSVAIQVLLSVGRGGSATVTLGLAEVSSGFFSASVVAIAFLKASRSRFYLTVTTLSATMAYLSGAISFFSFLGPIDPILQLGIFTLVLPGLVIALSFLAFFVEKEKRQMI